LLTLAQRQPGGTARVVLSAPTGALRPLDALVAVDVSPSMTGTALGRLGPALRALFATAPAGSRVRVAAFAGRAEIFEAEGRAPSDVALEPVLGATHLALGSATRLEALLPVLEALEARGERPREIVLVGDGGVTLGPDHERFAAVLRRRGLELSVVALGDRAPHAELSALVRATRGTEISLAPAFQVASGSGRLAEAALALFSRPAVARLAWTGGGRTVELAPLRAGEGRVLELPAGAVLTADGRRLVPGAVRGETRALLAALAAPATFVAGAEAAACDAPAVEGGVSTDALPVALAEPRVCLAGALGVPPGAPRAPERTAGRGVPPGSLLAMLRARVIPTARRCFRRDRRGRLDYAVRAEYVFVLADREVVSAEVRGELPERLRTCLRGAIDDLDVPPFEGRVVVRYPLRTERVEPLPALELQDGTARALDEALGDAPRGRIP
ncbi:MAG: vWA domain-containing protein, partial [Myxococcota bacterium]